MIKKKRGQIEKRDRKNVERNRGRKDARAMSKVIGWDDGLEGARKTI